MFSSVKHGPAQHFLSMRAVNTQGKLRGLAVSSVHSLVPYTNNNWERSGSVVECLTQDRRAVGSSLTGVSALCP